MKNKQAFLQKFVRGVLLLLLLLVLCAAGTGIAAAVKYRQCALSADRAEIAKSAELTAARDVPIGSTIGVSAEIRAPWGRALTELAVQPGKNSQLVGTPSFERIKTGWGFVVWKLDATVLAYRPGEIPAGSITVQIEGGAEKKQELNLALPAFTAKALAVAADETPGIAGRIEHPVPPERVSMKWTLGAIAAVLIFAAFWYMLYRRHARRSTVPPWTSALSSIARIRDDLHSGSSNAANAITRLTDVVRGYLEVRFHLRAEHQTTREFLDEIHAGGPLEQTQREFLKEFLASADMVKFAKAPADVMAFDEAAARAETLVRETAATEKEGKEKSK